MLYAKRVQGLTVALLAACGARSEIFDRNPTRDAARDIVARVDTAPDTVRADAPADDTRVDIVHDVHTDANRDCSVTACGAPVQLALGQHHSCALFSTGLVRCWGGNDHGQLGDGTTMDRTRPVDVLGVPRARRVVAGYLHTCIVGDDGSLWCWGDNASGQLGVGPTPPSSSRPMQVDLPRQVLAVSLGLAHSCAAVGGTPYCWGENDQGQVGDGTTISRNRPVVIFGLVGPVGGIAAGARHTCFADSGSGLWCFGLNSQGQYGDGTTMQRRRPTPPPIRVNGSTVTGCTTCIRRSEGLACSGPNSFGQLGDGTTIDRLSPVPPLGPAVRETNGVAVGCGHACFVDNLGTVRCSGWNANGELGAGMRSPTGTMLMVRGVSNPTVIALGHHHGCAVGADWRLRCWGDNSRGQLGDGTNTTRDTPVVIDH